MQGLVLLILIIYISATLSQALVGEKHQTNKTLRHYVNGKILLKSAKYKKESVKNTPASESYTAFQVVGVPKTVQNVPDSPYFPIDRTDDPKARFKKELADYPWTLFRQKRSANLDVVPIEDKKVISVATEVVKLTDVKPSTPSTPTTLSTSTTSAAPKTTAVVPSSKVPTRSGTKKNAVKAVAAKKNIKRLSKNKTVARTPKKQKPKNKRPARKGRKTRSSKSKKTAAVRAKPKGKKNKPARIVRAKNAVARVNKAAKKKGKTQKRTAPKRTQKRTKTNKRTKANKRQAKPKKTTRRASKNPKETRRLIAAREALIEDYPYVVSIQKNKQHWCSGALLNPRLVITTANCLWKATHMSRMEVRAGSRHTTHGGQIVGIQEVMKHPRWGLRKNPDNDVALLLLDQNIRFSDSVHGIDLPNRKMLPPFEDAWITSWGSERRDGIYDPTFSSTLQVYHARVIDMDKCNNITMRFSVVVTENFICLAQSGRQAPCTRDTGAPAVSDGILWGLASWGLRKLCGTERFPAVFSYLASHSNMDFIINATRYLMSDKRQYPFADRYPNIPKMKEE